jgi:hypothetical protein
MLGRQLTNDVLSGQPSLYGSVSGELDLIAHSFVYRIRRRPFGYRLPRPLGGRGRIADRFARGISDGGK